MQREGVSVSPRRIFPDPPPPAHNTGTTLGIRLARRQSPSASSKNTPGVLDFPGVCGRSRQDSRTGRSFLGASLGCPEDRYPRMGCPTCSVPFLRLFSSPTSGGRKGWSPYHRGWNRPSPRHGRLKSGRPLKQGKSNKLSSNVFLRNAGNALEVFDLPLSRFFFPSTDKRTQHTAGDKE